MTRQKTVTVLWMAAGVPLAVGAVAGLALSFGNVVDVVRPIVGPRLAPVFPLVWDVILLGAAVAYLATAYSGRPRPMWRVISQGGIVGTIAVNAVAAVDVKTLVVHVSGPAAWAVLVEAGAAQLRADHRGTGREPVGESIPWRLWVWSPRESAATWVRMARRLDGEHAAARLDAGLHAAAVQALRVAVPGRDGRATRRILHRQLQAGTLAPQTVLAACGWLDRGETGDPGQRVLRATLGAALGTAAGGHTPPVSVTVLDQPAAVQAVNDQPAGQPHLALAATGQDRPPDANGDCLADVQDHQHDTQTVDTQPVDDRVGEGPDPGGLAGDDPVWVTARAVAADLARQGRRVTRAGLLDGLRDRGVACSTTRGGQLVRQLRDTGPA